MCMNNKKLYEEYEIIQIYYPSEFLELYMEQYNVD